MHPTNNFHDEFSHVDSFAEAHGIRFINPNDPSGEHGNIWIMFEGSPVPPELFLDSTGKTVRWKAAGTGYDDLSLTPSILHGGPNRASWHGYVTKGAIITV